MARWALTEAQRRPHRGVVNHLRRLGHLDVGRRGRRGAAGEVPRLHGSRDVTVDAVHLLRARRAVVGGGEIDLVAVRARGAQYAVSRAGFAVATKRARLGLRRVARATRRGGTSEAFALALARLVRAGDATLLVFRPLGAEVPSRTRVARVVGAVRVRGLRAAGTHVSRGAVAAAVFAVVRLLLARAEVAVVTGGAKPLGRGEARHRDVGARRRLNAFLGRRELDHRRERTCGRRRSEAPSDYPRRCRGVAAIFS